MHISKDFFDQINPSYQNLIIQLENDLAACEKECQKNNWGEYSTSSRLYYVIEKFSSNYLTPKEYWNYTNTLQYFRDDKRKKDLNWMAFHNHFYLPETGEQKVVNIDGIRNDISDSVKYLRLLKVKNKFQTSWCGDEDDLRFPNAYIKECFHNYESNLRVPARKELIHYVNESIKLFDKIEDAENNSNLNEWFKLLLEAKDHYFVCDNVEYTLGQNFLNLELWKLYIEYLRDIEPKYMLQIYSKCCRFFLDDKEMYEKYKNEYEKYGPINLHWENLFDFEQNPENLKIERPRRIKRLIPNPYYNGGHQPYDKNLAKNIYDNLQIQSFSLPKPFIHYILQASKHNSLKKLYYSCKYFFYKMQKPICCYFYMNINYKNENNQKSLYKYDEESISIEDNKINKNFIKNLFISTVFGFKTELLYSHSHKHLTYLIPHLYRCDAKYISIFSQYLGWNELKFLIQSGNVIHLWLSHCSIRTNENDYIALEDIMKFLPNIEKLRLCSEIKMNENTANMLNNLKFNGKVYEFQCCFIGEPFDPLKFKEFYIKNRATYFYLRLYFSSDFKNKQNFIKIFRTILNDPNITPKLFTKIEINI